MDNLLEYFDDDFEIVDEVSEDVDDEETFNPLSKRPIAFSIPVGDEKDTLYAWYNDAAMMIPPNVDSLLQFFKWGHFSFLRYLTKMDEELLTPPADMVKSYYKFRHNCFGGLCNIQMGKIMTLDTDVSFNLVDARIGSDRSPDYIEVTLNEEGKSVMKILEYTVAFREGVGDYQKGGKLFDYKYSDEIRKAKSLGYVVDMRNLIFTLSNPNYGDLSEKVGIGDFSVFKESLMKFRNIAMTEITRVSKAFVASEDLVFSEKVKEKFELILEAMTGTFERPDITQFHGLDKRVLSMTINWESWDNTLKKMQRANHFFVISNKDGTKFYLTTQKKEEADYVAGFTRSELAQIIIDKNYAKIYSNLKPSRKDEVLKNDVEFLSKYRVPDANLYKFDESDFSIPVGYSRNKITYPNKYIKEYYPVEDEKPSMAKYRVKFDYTKYMEDLVALDLSKLTTQKNLGNNELTIDVVEKAVENYSEKLDTINKVAIKGPKQTFIYPVATGILSAQIKGAHGDIYHPDKEWLLDLSKAMGNEAYTKNVLRKAAKGEYSPVMRHELDSVMKEKKKMYSDALADVHNAYKKKHPESKSRIPKKKFLMQDPELVSLQKIADEKYKEYMKSLKKNKSPMLRTIAYRIGSKKNSTFQEEMSHYGRQGNKEFRGVGSAKTIYKDLHNYFEDLAKFLMVETSSTTANVTPILSDVQDFGLPKFIQMKKQLEGEYKGMLDEFYKTNLATILEFIARLCKSLFRYSSDPYNKNYVSIDGLGYKNAVLIVRGGKSLYKTGKSKLFRVAFPIRDNNLDATYMGFAENSDFRQVSIDNKLYVITPWQQMHSQVLIDGMSIVHRVFAQLTSTSLRCGITNYNEMRFNFALPALLALHNRRKTEAFMHNCRYLTVNCFAEFTNITDILSEFATFNYTYFDAWLKESLRQNYLEFAKPIVPEIVIDGETKVKTAKLNSKTDVGQLLKTTEIKHYFTRERIWTLEELNAINYSTYLMTKAPTEKVVEQAINIQPIFEDVMKYKSKHTVKPLDNDLLKDLTPDEIVYLKREKEKEIMFPPTMEINALKPKNEDYDDDFNYDPAMVQYIGYRLQCRFQQLAGKGVLAAEWSKMLHMNIDKIANPKGLRGFNQENFFGEKGYTVVYEHLMMSEDYKLVEKLLKELVPNNDESLKRFMVDNHQRFIDILPKLWEEDHALVFHIVDKAQRAGNREIFVMDFFTKLMQHLIENYFGFLAEFLDNEMISVPSSNRSGVIHGMFYETGGPSWAVESYNFVLDCRRWAPRSVLQKYMHMLFCMMDVLPESFVVHTMCYLAKMLKKKFITRTYVMDFLKNHDLRKKAEDMLFTGTFAKDSVDFEVPFSFVMGIHNFMSSVLHAEQQKMIAEVLLWRGFKNEDRVILKMLAHSDDSAGKLMCKSSTHIKDYVKLYDWLMKTANHMLSIKKSQVNRGMFFEFLSVLYLGMCMLSLIIKFMSSMQFIPTDKGYAVDSAYAISKAIEIMSYGGTMSEAYLAMKLATNFIRTLYGFRPEDKVMPYQFGDEVDMHPIEALISGGESEIMNFGVTKPELWDKLISYSETVKVLDLEEDINYNVVWDMGSKLPKSLRDKFESVVVPEKIAESWSLANVKLATPALNVLWFSNMLKQRSFYSSAVNDPSEKRISRLFGAVKNRSILNKDNLMIDANYFIQNCRMICQGQPITETYNIDVASASKHRELLKLVHQPYYNLIESIPEEINVIPKIMHTTKPIRVLLPQTSLGGVQDLTSSYYVIYKKEPYMANIVGFKKDLASQVSTLDKYIIALGLEPDKMSASSLSKLANRLLNKADVSYKFIAPVPSELRKITDYDSILNYISHTSMISSMIRWDHSKAKEVDSRRLDDLVHVPDEVKNYMQLLHTWELVQEYSLEDANIFMIDIPATLAGMMRVLPTEWKLMLTTSTGGQPLSNISYWRYWRSKQKKGLTGYAGEGRLVMKVMEGTLEFVTRGQSIEKIYVDPNVKTGFFNTTTTWYLARMVDNTSGLMTRLVNIDEGEDGVRYIGYSKNENLFGYNYRQSFDFIFVDTVVNPIDIDVKILESITTGGYKPVSVEGTKYKVFFTHFGVGQLKHAKFKGVIDPVRLIAASKEKNIDNFIRSVISESETSFIYDSDHVIRNMNKLTIYHILYNTLSKLRDSPLEISATRSVFFDMFRTWKETHEDFGFPTDEELIEMHTKGSMILPVSALDFLHKYGVRGLTTTEISYLVETLRQFGSDNMSIDTVISVIEGVYSKQTGEYAMMLASTKNDMIRKTFKFLGDTNLAFTILKSVVSCAIDSLKNNTLKVGSFLSGMPDLKNKLPPERKSFEKSDYVQYVWELAMSELLNSSDPDANRSFFASLLCKILKDLWSLGLRTCLLDTQYQYTPIRFINFELTLKEFIEFMYDLMCEISIYAAKSRYKEPRELHNEMEYWYRAMPQMFRDIQPVDDIRNIKILLKPYTWRARPITERSWRNSPVVDPDYREFGWSEIPKETEPKANFFKPDEWLTGEDIDPTERGNIYSYSKLAYDLSEINDLKDDYQLNRMPETTPEVARYTTNVKNAKDLFYLRGAAKTVIVVSHTVPRDLFRIVKNVKLYKISKKSQFLTKTKDNLRHMFKFLIILPDLKGRDIDLHTSRDSNYIVENLSPKDFEKFFNENYCEVLDTVVLDSNKLRRQDVRDQARIQALNRNSLILKYETPAEVSQNTVNIRLANLMMDAPPSEQETNAFIARKSAQEIFETYKKASEFNARPVGDENDFDEEEKNDSPAAPKTVNEIITELLQMNRISEILAQGGTMDSRIGAIKEDVATQVGEILGINKSIRGEDLCTDVDIHGVMNAIKPGLLSDLMNRSCRLSLSQKKALNMLLGTCKGLQSNAVLKAGVSLIDTIIKDIPESREGDPTLFNKLSDFIVHMYDVYHIKQSSYFEEDVLPEPVMSNRTIDMNALASLLNL